MSTFRIAFDFFEKWFGRIQTIEWILGISGMSLASFSTWLYGAPEWAIILAGIGGSAVCLGIYGLISEFKARKPASPIPVSSTPATTSQQITLPASGEKPAQQPPQNSQPAIQRNPIFGNLKERATTLSDEIMNDLTMHGWIRDVPADPDQRQEWVRRRSNYFRDRFLQRVVNIRNEFNEFHIQDRQLDDIINFASQTQQVNDTLGIHVLGRHIDILPQQIVMASERLRFMADRID